MFFRNIDEFNINKVNIDDEFDNNNHKFRGILIIGIVVLVIICLVIYFLFNNKKIVVNDVDTYLELIGANVVTIYKNTEYIEFGYKAYNSNNEDLNNEVVVNSNLNTNEVGEYEIIYELDEKKLIRKIVVIDKPIDYTYIYLNSIDNDIDVYLKLGDNYVEPGYMVFSSNEDLNDKVTVTGRVDTNKGSYKITYSVVDSKGVTVSKSRIVYVMDAEIILSLDNTSWTNKEVTINILVNDEFFDYMILPDGSRIKNKSYKLKVNKNGKYLFKVYNQKGILKEKLIEVANIDKEKPNGSCLVDHDKNGSYISLNVSDISGIKRYSYNGKDYNGNKIVLNNYIDKASVMVYDNAGNSNKIDCKVLELKDELLVDKSHYTDMAGFNVYNVKISSVDLTNIGCGVTFSAGSGNYIKSIRVHQKISDNFHGILTNVCKYINKSSWINELQTAGAYVNRENAGGDYHAAGLAIDLNNEWSYTFNGKKYTPYPYQGYSTWQAYNDFVCDVCSGKEDCEYNVNYIIFKRYFEGNGWCWGGNWGVEHFDPMHFEIRPNNKCAIGRKQQISCK